MSYKPIESCTTVAELLADPARWTQGVGRKDGPWCLYRAANRVCSDPVAAWKSLAAVIGTSWIDQWNDAPGRTHAEVLDAVKRANI